MIFDKHDKSRRYLTSMTDKGRALPPRFRHIQRGKKISCQHINFLEHFVRLARWPVLLFLKVFALPSKTSKMEFDTLPREKELQELSTKAWKGNFPM